MTLDSLDRPRDNEKPLSSEQLKDISTSLESALKDVELRKNIIALFDSLDSSLKDKTSAEGGFKEIFGRYLEGQKNALSQITEPTERLKIQQATTKHLLDTTIWYADKKGDANLRASAIDLINQYTNATEQIKDVTGQKTEALKANLDQFGEKYSGIRGLPEGTEARKWTVQYDDKSKREIVRIVDTKNGDILHTIPLSSDGGLMGDQNEHTYIIGGTGYKLSGKAGDFEMQTVPRIQNKLKGIVSQQPSAQPGTAEQLSQTKTVQSETNNPRQSRLSSESGTTRKETISESEIMIRDFFHISGEITIPEGLKNIKGDVISELKKRGIFISGLNERSFTINFPREIIGDNRTRIKVVEKIEVAFKFNNTIDQYLQKLSTIPTTRLDREVSLNSHGIVGIGGNGDFIRLDKDIFAVQADNTIGSNNVLRFNNGVYIYDFEVISGGYRLYTRNENTNNIETHILTQKKDGSIYDGDKMIARKKTQTEITQEQENERNRIKNTFDLNELYRIDTITVNTEGKSFNERFPNDLRSTFEAAKKAGIELNYDGSRSNGINIIQNGEKIGNIRVFKNGEWKKQLIQVLEDRLNKT